MIVGIICEYNPLHNGHKRHIELTREHYPDCDIVCVMTGSFTQRGEPSVMDKFLRAKHAVLSGADLVVELPFVFSTSPADDFSYGAVKWLSGLKVNVISFGSECGSLEQLKLAATRIAEPSDEAKEEFSSLLKSGLSYPRALSESLAKVYNDFTLESPNNLLGVQYIVKSQKLNPAIEHFTVHRPNNYNNAEVNDSFCSSRALRGNASNLQFVKSSVPDFVFNDWKHFDYSTFPAFNDFAFKYFRLLSAEQLEPIAGVTEGIQNKFVDYTSSNYEEFITSVKSKRYTLLRLKRIVLHSVFGITKDLVSEAKTLEPYYNVLAVSKDKLRLLEMTVPTIKQLNPVQQKFFDIDRRATDFLSALRGTKGGEDYSTSMKKY